MILYHGSIELVDKPKIRARDTFLDFGIGFYTTTSYEQAERWVNIKMRREKSAVGYVSAYEFDFEAAKDETMIQRIWNGLCLLSQTGKASRLPRRRICISVRLQTTMFIRPFDFSKPVSMMRKKP